MGNGSGSLDNGEDWDVGSVINFPTHATRTSFENCEVTLDEVELQGPAVSKKLIGRGPEDRQISHWSNLGTLDDILVAAQVVTRSMFVSTLKLTPWLIC